MPVLQNRLLRKRSPLIFVICFFFLFLSASRYVFSETLEPPASFAKEAFEQGRMAAEGNRWNLAAQFFSEAQKADPLLPEALFNLGVAHEMNGSPVLAVLWFQAFLEASPESLKAVQASEKILALTNEIEIKTEELFTLAEKAAEAIPAEIENAREEALRAVNLVRAIAGKNRSEPIYLRIYGEYLAAARDYEGAGALLAEIGDAAEQNRLLHTLGSYQIFREERALALQTIRRMSESEEKFALLESLLVAFTRELNVREAEPLVNEVHQEGEQAKLKELLILGYLKAGLAEEAKKAASQIKDSRMAKVVLGKGKEVLNELKKEVPDPKKPWKKDLAAYQVTSALAWLGEKELAQEAVELAGAGDYRDLARALVASEDGRFQETLDLMRKMAPAIESDFALSLFWRLVHQDRLVEVEQLSEAVRSNMAKSNLLRLLARVYREKGDMGKSAEFASRSFEAAIASNSSLTLRSFGQEAAVEGKAELVEAAFHIEWVTHWIALARALERKDSIYDLAAYFEKYQGGEYITFARAVTRAAGDWASALTYLRGTQKWHGQGATR